MSRCQALTVRKAQCSLNTLTGSNLCHVHKKMADRGKQIHVYLHNANRANEVKQSDVIVPNTHLRIYPIEKKNTKKSKTKNSVKSKRTKKDDPDDEQYGISDDIKNYELFEPLYLSEENECKCCFEKYSPSEVIMCTGSNQKFQHITCRDCLKGYMESVLNEKRSVGCMMSCEGCGGRYNDLEVKMILPEDDYKRYVESTSVEEAISLAKILDNYFTCPFCSKYGVIIDDTDQLNNQSILCQQCKKNWCIKCRNESHVPDPCGKLRNSDDESIRKVIELTIDDSMIHKCPKCFTRYDKEDGCNLMTCKSCHTYSCYICGIQIVPKNNLKYWHFKGSGSADKDAVCLLYNNEKGGSKEDITAANIDYNNKRIIESLQKLIDINMDNPEIAQKLYEHIIKRGFKIKKYEFKIKFKIKPNELKLIQTNQTVPQSQLPTRTPIQTTVNSSINIPVSVPIQDPIQVPTQIPSRVPIQTNMLPPVQVPIGLPVQPIIQPPIIQPPIQAPIELPIRTPVNPPIKVPIRFSDQIQIPIQIPTKTPQRSLPQIPIQVPAQNQSPIIQGIPIDNVDIVYGIPVSPINNSINKIGGVQMQPQITPTYVDNVSHNDRHLQQKDCLIM
jgi:hypothetical protein